MEVKSRSDRPEVLRDLEAVEMAVRSAMHHGGAAAPSELLQFPNPAAE